MLSLRKASLTRLLKRRFDGISIAECEQGDIARIYSKPLAALRCYRLKPRTGGMVDQTIRPMDLFERHVCKLVGQGDEMALLPWARPHRNRWRRLRGSLRPAACGQAQVLRYPRIIGSAKRQDRPVLGG
jgi:hypothetical protein